MRNLAYWKARLQLAKEFDLPDEQNEAEGFIRVLEELKDQEQDVQEAEGPPK